MAAKSYFEKLKDPRWQRRRLEVLERAGFACECCLATDETLEIHHGLYRFGVDPWDLPEDTLWCLCSGCHQMHQDHLADLKLEIGRLHPGSYEEAIFAILDLKTTNQPTRDGFVAKP